MLRCTVLEWPFVFVTQELWWFKGSLRYLSDVTRGTIFWRHDQSNRMWQLMVLSFSSLCSTLFVLCSCSSTLGSLSRISKIVLLHSVFAWGLSLLPLSPGVSQGSILGLLRLPLEAILRSIAFLFIVLQTMCSLTRLNAPTGNFIALFERCQDMVGF